MKMKEYLKNIEDNNVSYWLYARENLKPNDYVKLNTGEITRSMNVSPIKGNRVYYANGDDCWFDISAVRNFSPNIIDLIEVGDILYLEESDDIACMFFKDIYLVKNEDNLLNIIGDIKNKKCKLISIVTKEQFEAMQYNLESEVN